MNEDFWDRLFQPRDARDYMRGWRDYGGYRHDSPKDNRKGADPEPRRIEARTSNRQPKTWESPKFTGTGRKRR